MEDLIALMENYGGCFAIERDRELPGHYYKIRLDCRGLRYVQLVPIDDFKDHRDEILTMIVNNFVQEYLI